MITRDRLSAYCNDLLAVGDFKDYCPNGLQVQGCDEVSKIVTGVTASAKLIDLAIAAKADALLVHHGFFWKGEAYPITGLKYERIAKLIKHNINLFGYHLPLDAHDALGNNVQLAKQMQWPIVGQTGRDNLLFYGDLDQPQTQAQFIAGIATVLGRTPLVVGAQSEIRRVAWCTGAAQSFIDDAIEIRADVFVSGEISENTVHTADEAGIQYVSAGHHATERYGVQALGEHLAAKFELTHEFIDVDNPV